MGLNPFQSKLLTQTIEHAILSTEFYREKFGEISPSEIDSLENLQQLPLVSKDQLIRAGASAKDQSLDTALLQRTSGTTGPPWVLERSSAEVAFIQEFFSKLIDDSGNSLPRPLVLSMHGVQHGSPTPVPAHAMPVTHFINDDASAQAAFHSLERDFDIPGTAERISTISGSFTQIMLLTQRLLCESDPYQHKLRNSIKHILVTADYLSHRSRDLLEKSWEAKVSSRYSLSEVFGGATASREHFSFDVHVIAEMIKLHSDAPLLEGTGRLVLTPLYPFVQKLPLIRYVTGDIFHRSGDVFQFLGRHNRCLTSPVDPDELLISEVVMYELLDALPFVRRVMLPPDAFPQTSRTFGPPVFEMQIEKQHQGNFLVKIVVRTTNCMKMFPELTQLITRRILRELCHQSKAFAKLTALHTIETRIDFVADT